MGTVPANWSIQQQLIDLYFKAFPRTLLLMNFDALPALEYGVKRGAGWRLDCWGDMGAPGRNFAHMKDLYPQQLARGGALAERVADEARGARDLLECPEQWHQWKYPLEPILDQALRWHASTINLKSSKIPDDWKAAFDEFQKRIGYRFVLKKLDYPSEVSRGIDGRREHVVVQCRRRARLSAVHAGPGDRRHRDPARRRHPAMAARRSVYENTIAVPSDVAPGRYPVRVALLDPASRQAGDTARDRRTAAGRLVSGRRDHGELRWPGQRRSWTESRRARAPSGAAGSKSTTARATKSGSSSTSATPESPA